MGSKRRINFTEPVLKLANEFDHFVQADIRNDVAMAGVFADFAPDVVLHFAASSF